MSAQLRLHRRLTRHYVDQHRHLDQHRYLGDVRVLPRRQTRTGNGHDDLGDFVRTVYLTADMARTYATKTIARALTETFRHWGCSHEHDCCGCPLIFSSAQKISNRRWLVRESIGRNL